MNTTQAPPKTDQPVYVITDDDKKRQQKIQKAWEAYEGELDKPFEQLADEPDPNVMGNEVLPAVDAIVNFVFGDEVEISAEESAPAGAQELLDKVWGRKEARIPLLQRWIMNGDIAGTAFLRIVPGRNPQNKTFRLVEVDPSIVSVKTAPQDRQTALLYCLQYCDEEPDEDGKSQKIFYREEISRVDPDQATSQDLLDDAGVTWSIQHWTQKTQGGTEPTKGNWIPAGEPIPWNYPFPPIFSNQNLPKPNSFWGYAGVNKSLIAVNEAINVVNSNINITEKIQRILYANGVGEGTIDVHPGKITQLPLPESKIEAVNLQTNTANSRAFAGDLRGEAEELTGVPMIASGRTAYMPSGNLSGIAIKLLFMSLLKKMNKMRCLYGETMIEISQAILTLANFKGADINITLGWTDPLPTDELHDVQASLAKGELGVSKTTRMRELNYDPEEEAKLVAKEQAEAQPPQLPVSPEAVPPLPGQPKPAPELMPGQQNDNQQQDNNQQKQPIGQKG